MMACVGLCPLQALREISWRPDKAWVGLDQVFAVSLRRNTRINQKGLGGKVMGKFFFSLDSRVWRYLVLVYRCISIVGYYVSDRRVRVLSQQSLS